MRLLGRDLFERALQWYGIAKLARQKQEAAFDDLSRQVAHDIRSPVTALLILSDELAPSLSEDKRQMLTGITQRIYRIAADLEKRARPTANPLQQVSVREALQSIIAEKRVVHGNRPPILIEKGEEAIASPIVKADPGDFHRVLSNLFNNAYQALSENGEIRVAVDRSREFCSVRITDNGRGIPSEFLPHLMTKHATFGKEGGCGLGLYHAKQSIESWGGRIEIHSEKGKGTQVLLELRLA